MKVKLLRLPEQEVSLHNLHILAQAGKIYEVFGLFMPDNDSLERIYVCIADDAYEELDHTQDEPYPVFIPISCLEFIDPQVRPDWELARWDEEISGHLLTFPEWAQNESFYYRLVDGRKQELQVFAKIYDRYSS